MPKVDFTITISILLAICALFAPSFTAVITNRHQYKMRKLDLEYDMQIHYSDLIYRNKYDTYKTFLNIAGNYNLTNEYIRGYAEILAASQNVLLLCDSLSKPLLLEFIDALNSCPRPAQSEYTLLLNKISSSFNRELSLLSMSSYNK